MVNQESYLSILIENFNCYKKLYYKKLARAWVTESKSYNNPKLGLLKSKIRRSSYWGPKLWINSSWLGLLVRSFWTKNVNHHKSIAAALNY